MPNRSDEVEMWRFRIERAEARLRLEQQRWQAGLDAYRGFLYPEEEEMIYRQEANILYALIRRLLPRIYFRDPRILTRPRIDDPLATRAASSVARYLMQTYDRLEVGEQVRKAVRDAFFFNRGWLKVGYQAEFERRDQLDEQYGAAEPAFPEAATLAERKALLKKFRLEPEEVSFDERVTSERVFVQHVHPRYILTDPDVTDPERGAWMAHVVPKRLQPLRESSLYRAEITRYLEPLIMTDEIFGQATYPLGMPMTGSTGAPIARPREKSEWTKIYEVWSRETGELLVLGTQGDDYLRAPQDWPYAMDFPMFSVQFNDDPDRAWGQPDTEIWLPLVRSINDFRRKRRNRVLKNASKILVNKDRTDESTIEGLDSREEQAVVQLIGEGSARDAAVRLDPATTPPDLAVAEARDQEMLSNVAFMSQQRRGANSPYATATENAIIEQAIQDVEDDRLAIVEKFCRKVATALLSLTRQFYDQDEIVSEIGIDGFSFYRVTPAMLKFPYDVRIQVGSTAYKSLNQRIREHVEFLQLAGPFQGTDIVVLLRRIGEMMDIDNPENVVLDPLNPQNMQRMLMLAEARRILGVDFEKSLLGGAGAGAAPPSAGLAGEAAGGMAEGGSAPKPETEAEMAGVQS